MGVKAFERRAAAVTRDQRRAIGGEVRRLREDTGIGLRELAGHAGISPAYLCEIEAGNAAPTLAVLNRIAVPLGADLSVRLYPNTGPRIRDRISTRMLERFFGHCIPDGDQTSKLRSIGQLGA